MKLKQIPIFLFVLLLLAFNSFAQVKVTSEKITYKRTGTNLLDHKKSFDVNYPKFSGPNKEVLRRLEKTFDYWRVFGTSLEEETEFQWLDSLDFKVAYNKNNVLVIEMIREGSGAYPSGETKTVVANSTYGSPVTMTDVFKNRIGLFQEIDKAQKAEMNAADKAYITGGGEESLFDENVEKASDQVEEFSVNDYGITFIFDYGFPHVSQALEPPGRFFFSWKQLEPYLREFSQISLVIEKAPTPGRIVPIVDLRIGGLLGGVQEGKFVNAVTASNELLLEPSFVWFGADNINLGMKLSSYNAAWKGKLTADQPDDICPEFRYVELTPKAESGVAIGGNGNWDPVPNKVEEIFKGNPVYRDVVAAYLKSRGFGSSPVKIEQIYKVDLEGDGADEIVIRATNLTYSENELVADKGGYSFVIVRKIVGGAVKNILLAGDFIDADHGGAENSYEISSILDLNGDGRMEIIVYGQYYEGAGVSAYSIENGAAKVALETGCGL